MIRGGRSYKFSTTTLNQYFYRYKEYTIWGFTTQLVKRFIDIIKKKRRIGMKIYTKQGDEGRTTNILGDKFLKSHDIMELQGCIDEVNAAIGVLRSKLNNLPVGEKEQLDTLLKAIQYHLYETGIEISYNFTEVYITEDKINFLEEQIDKMTGIMPPLTSFIYYGELKLQRIVILLEQL